MRTDTETKVSRSFVATLSMMSVGSILGSDAFLPALPQIAESLQVKAAAVQTGVGIYLFGLAASQLLFGFLADRIGSRTAAIIGCALYILSSVACAAAVNLPQLLICRLLQGLGGGSGLVIARAVAGGRLDHRTAVRVTATASIFVGLTPAAAPGAAGLAVDAIGWRAAPVLTALFATATLVMISIRLGEDPADGRRVPGNLFLGDYGRIVRRARFWATCVMAVSAYAAYYAYLSVSPFLFERHGWRPDRFWLLYLNLSLMFAVGSLVARRLVGRTGPRRGLTLGMLIASGGCLAVIPAALVPATVPALLVASSMLVFGNGFLLPLSSAGVVSSFKTTPGMAAAAYSFLQMTLAAGAAASAGGVTGNTALGLGLFMAVLGLSGAVVHQLIAVAHRRQRLPLPEEAS